MNRLKHQLVKGSRGRTSQVGLRVAAATFLIASMALAQAAEIQIVRQAGGISPNPVLTSVSSTNKQVTVGWQAFNHQVKRGSNVVFQLVKCPALQGTNTTWSTVATVTNATTITVPADGAAGFMTVRQSPAPLYAGAETCGLCHVDTHDSWMTTLHSGAFQTLKAAGMDKNASCLPCHTVGYGTASGFKDEATTPQLAGVQCENCHGPAGGHASAPLDKFNNFDLSKAPVRTFAAEMCGGCHSAMHHPTYEEWATSKHGTTQIPEAEFSDPASGPGRMMTCGACHSAASRLTLLNGVQQYPDPADFAANITTNSMPSTDVVSTTGLTCVTCHDPHSKTDNGAQLRFPLASKVPFSYNTGTNFAANYNPQVQTCAQCHNMRGASWTGTSRPPHHSPQYNILIGYGGYDAGVTNVPQSAHMDIETQCVQCHTHPHTPPSVTATSPAYMGHDFNPTMQACAPCHDEVGAELIKDAVQANVKQQIAEIKGLLDQWALTKAPAALSQKYGALAWEFGSIGQLSTPTAQVTAGPSATEQKAVPDSIKQARHNLYMVDNDHSYGVHNGNYTRFLLNVARTNVNAALQAQ
jgi:Cytochrome c554 and c-prime/Doubled CXXCH motif (Paired_CXXCH_1)